MILFLWASERLLHQGLLTLNLYKGERSNDICFSTNNITHLVLGSEKLVEIIKIHITLNSYMIYEQETKKNHKRKKRPQR